MGRHAARARPPAWRAPPLFMWLALVSLLTYDFIFRCTRVSCIVKTAHQPRGSSAQVSHGWGGLARGHCTRHGCQHLFIHCRAASSAPWCCRTRASGPQHPARRGMAGSLGGHPTTASADQQVGVSRAAVRADSQGCAALCCRHCRPLQPATFRSQSATIPCLHRSPLPPAAGSSLGAAPASCGRASWMRRAWTRS